jgi:short-subunit dehydrogenase
MGLAGVNKMTDYCASKFAAIGFHESLRQELNQFDAPHLIQTTLMCPGLIHTGMFKGLRVELPFLMAPLSPQQVVDRMMDALQTGVIVPDAYTVLPKLDDVRRYLDKQSVPWLHRMFQHKVIWTPLTFYLPVWITQTCPAWVGDFVKNVTGGNGAITSQFVGRKK